jgi:hypothetical protein
MYTKRHFKGFLLQILFVRILSLYSELFSHHSLAKTLILKYCQKIFVHRETHEKRQQLGYEMTVTVRY